MKGLIVVLVSLFISSCATSSKQIQATYVSPLIYKDYDCEQLSLEADRISRRVSELTGQIDKRAAGDKTQMAVALVIFWPALFFLGNNEAQNAELSKLKGESEALEEAAIKRKCNIEPKIETETTDVAANELDKKTAQEVTEEASNPAAKSAKLSSETYLELAELARKRDEGVITQEEFETKEVKLLSN